MCVQQFINYKGHIIPNIAHHTQSWKSHSLRGNHGEIILHFGDETEQVKQDHHTRHHLGSQRHLLDVLHTHLGEHIQEIERLFLLFSDEICLSYYQITGPLRSVMFLWLTTTNPCNLCCILKSLASFQSCQVQSRWDMGETKGDTPLINLRRQAQ